MYESPIKALTEKILEAELYEEHKDDFDQVDDLSKNNISGFCNLKKRSSVNNKIANIRNDSTGTINIDDSKSNYLYCKEDDKPSINLPMVKQEGKQFISTESRTDSYTKLEIKYSKETEGSITGLRYPTTTKDLKNYSEEQNNLKMPVVEKQIPQKSINFTCNILNDPVRTSRKISKVNKAKGIENMQQVNTQKEGMVHSQKLNSNCELQNPGSLVHQFHSAVRSNYDIDQTLKLYYQKASPSQYRAADIYLLNNSKQVYDPIRQQSSIQGTNLRNSSLKQSNSKTKFDSNLCVNGKRHDNSNARNM